MATTNGTLTPPVASSDSLHDSETSTHKRKREDDALSPLRQNAAPSRSQQTQQDILQILEQHDITPSFLKQDFAQDESSSREPSQKKARLANSAGKSTISDKLNTGAYTSLQSLKEDATRVTQAMEASLRAKVKEEGAQTAGRLSVDDLKQIQRAKAFEQLIIEVVDKEAQYEAVHQQEEFKKEAVTMVNGHATDAKASLPSRTGTVLTLFGNAPTPKQLFSSMQNASSAKQEAVIKSELPVEEMSLPNGLTATKIMPAPEDGKKGPIFEEAYAPPYNLSTLHPPKRKRPSAYDHTLNWEFKDLVNRPSKKGGFTVQSMSTGDWLGYGGVDTATDDSPRAKRKQRERALSLTDSVDEPPKKESLEVVQAREEEALFRRAYSSFAPSCDNAKSVIPAETKSMMWWYKIGEQRFNETFAVDPALLDELPVANGATLPVEQEAGAVGPDFEKIIEELDQLEEEVPDAEPVTSKTDVDRVLQEISELLETLASYQRIRNATLPPAKSPNPRAPISPAPLIASRIGKPDEPAEEEMSTYHALRRELTYLVLKLPPYAVAKLNGDQLAELGVKAVIPFEAKDTKGTMEEDQVARLAKYNAMATAAGIATLTRGSSATGQHYSTTAQRTPAIGQAANTRYGQASQYAATRTPAAVAPQYQRSTSNQSQYGTPSATAPRSGYGQQPNQYTRPGATQQTYGQANNSQYYQQRPQQTSTGYTSYGQQTPQQRQNYSSSQALSQFQPRSHAAAATNAVAYQANSTTQQAQSGSPFNRTASPAKPVGHTAPTPPPANVQPRPTYAYAQQPAQSSSGRATPNYPSQPQTPVNGFQRPTPQPVAPRAAGGTPQPAVPRAASGTPQPAIQQLAQQVQANGHI